MKQRKIIFKGKRTDTGEWIKGDLVHAPCGCRIQRWVDDVLLVDDVAPTTVCQFTGLKDKNGKKVWEHDILIQAIENEVIFINGSFHLIGGDDSIPFSNLFVEDSSLKLWKNIGSKFDRKEGEK